MDQGTARPMAHHSAPDLALVSVTSGTTGSYRADYWTPLVPSEPGMRSGLVLLSGTWHRGDS